MPMIATTIINSINVNPLFCFNISVSASRRGILLAAACGEKHKKRPRTLPGPLLVD